MFLKAVIGEEHTFLEKPQHSGIDVNPVYLDNHVEVFKMEARPGSVEFLLQGCKGKQLNKNTFTKR